MDALYHAASGNGLADFRDDYVKCTRKLAGVYPKLQTLAEPRATVRDSRT